MTTETIELQNQLLRGLMAFCIETDLIPRLNYSIDSASYTWNQADRELIIFWSEDLIGAHLSDSNHRCEYAIYRKIETYGHLMAALEWLDKGGILDGN